MESQHQQHQQRQQARYRTIQEGYESLAKAFPQEKGKEEVLKRHEAETQALLKQTAAQGGVVHELALHGLDVRGLEHPNPDDLARQARKEQLAQQAQQAKQEQTRPLRKTVRSVNQALWNT